jgi:hypothetical protein
LELLRAAHAENAEIFVIAIDDVEASVRTAELIRTHFPHLKIFARARNRQHAFRLMDLDVRYTIRETLVSSLEMSVQVLESLGLSKSKALETVHRFRVLDEATMAKQHAVKDDEKKFLETSRESAEQLLHLFETDSEQPRKPRCAARSRTPRKPKQVSESSLEAASGSSLCLVGIEQDRGIETFKTGQNAAVRIVHDALRIFVAARSQQHADHHIILWARRVFTQELVSKARQSLAHFIGEFETHRVMAVADFRFLGDLANQARDEASLID